VVAVDQLEQLLEQIQLTHVITTQQTKYLQM
jgi:hypothetical protein